MKPIRHPPEAILRAYADLLDHVFLFLRYRSHDKSIDPQELFDLADALHNIGGLLVDYGSWTDDEKYREFYLRPFDEKWSAKSLRLELFLQSRMDQYLQK